MRQVLTLSVTEPGRRLAERLPFRHVHGDPGAVLASSWEEVDGLVVILAVGATVRLIAPLLRSKDRDPAVVCVDDAGNFAVVVCGGHAGGGNALADQVASLLGATPVVTTATDRLGVPALDRLPGLRAEGDVAAVTAALLAGRRPRLEQDPGQDGAWPLPDALTFLADRPPPGGRASPGGPWPAGEQPAEGAAETAEGEAEKPDAPPRVVVTDRAATPGEGPCVWLRPPSLVVGIGTTSSAAPSAALAAVRRTLEDAGLATTAVFRLATVDRRLAHPAVEAVAGALGAEVVAYRPEELDAVAVPAPSEVVRRAVGTGSVAEAAALLAAGPEGRLVAGKAVHGEITVAVARRPRPSGALAVVGLGPGHPAHRTPAAERAVRHAEVVVGFRGYLDRCRDLLHPGQQVLSFELGAELERVRRALAEAAAGRRVALVCSGDPGVYAMASPLLEEAGAPGPDGLPPYGHVPVEVVPGVTASLAAAAALGAPLGHDHAVVSLSDLHTPWERIEARVAAAAAADYVLVLYNPRSRRRTWQLEKVKAMLLEHRSPATPVGLVTDATRPGASVRLTTLGSLPGEEVGMTTCVVVGASTTVVSNGRMVTPRGYDR